MITETITDNGINSYYFIDRLSDYLNDDEIVVTDMGTSLTCTHAAIKLKKDQKIITSTGLGEMGFGLPGAIGAALGSKKRVVLICGEGSFMMNLQELQTMKTHNIPIIILLLNNNGYLTIKHTHNALYQSAGNAEATGTDNDISFPKFENIAKCFDIDYLYVDDEKSLSRSLKINLKNVTSDLFVEIKMPVFQELIPKLAVQLDENGNMTPASL